MAQQLPNIVPKSKRPAQSSDRQQQQRLRLLQMILKNESQRKDKQRA